jgi:hypothetical protein
MLREQICGDPDRKKSTHAGMHNAACWLPRSPTCHPKIYCITTSTTSTILQPLLIPFRFVPNPNAIAMSAHTQSYHEPGRPRRASITPVPLSPPPMSEGLGLGLDPGIQALLYELKSLRRELETSRKEVDALRREVYSFRDEFRDGLAKATSGSLKVNQYFARVRMIFLSTMVCIKYLRQPLL